MKKLSATKKTLKQLSKRLYFLILNKSEQCAHEIKSLIIQLNKLVHQLSPFIKKRELRRILGVVAIFVGVSFTQDVKAQAAFIAPVQNPFGITASSQFAIVSTADLDNDGDFDMLVGEYYGALKYYENTGTNTLPSFAAPLTNPFGLVSGQYLAAVTFSDLDNDGDLDIMLGEYYGNLKYYQNTGTATAPAFAAPVTNPFGLASTYYYAFPVFADMDNDGDDDLLVTEYYGVLQYFQNTGTANAPAFAAPVQNPFGFAPGLGVNFSKPTIADLDNDGDLDLMVGENAGQFRYFPNIGTATAPNFGPGQTNPFGLTNTYTLNFPSFVDLDNDGDLDIIAGEYYANFQYFENSFVANGPLAINNLTVSSPSCSPGGDGTITVGATGGMGPITYRIGTDSNTNGLFTNYNIGTYTVTVRDSVNTIVDSVITMVAPVPPAYDSLGSFITDVSCNGLNDGAIFAAITGGTAPINYNLNPGNINSAIGSFAFLTANIYTVIITDSKNCADTAMITVNQPPAINLTVDSISNISCFGGNDGEIFTTTSGGTAPLINAISPNIGSQSVPGDYINLTANSYTITVSDANGCTTTSVQTLTEPTAVVATITSTTNASSSFANDGVIVAIASGGTPGYIYTIAPNTGTQAPPGTFNNLGAGNYTVTATDANGCTNTMAAAVLADIPAALSDLSLLNIKVYPNPFENTLQIESEERIELIQILDMTGRTIKTEKNIKGSIPVGNLPKGIYILKVALTNGEEGKMIIQKR